MTSNCRYDCTAGESMTMVAATTNTGDDHQRKVHERIGDVIQAADPLGIHQARPHAQAHQEGAGHAAARLIQKIDEVEMRAHGDDQFGAFFIDREQDDILAGAAARQHIER